MGKIKYVTNFYYFSSNFHSVGFSSAPLCLDPEILILEVVQGYSERVAVRRIKKTTSSNLTHLNIIKVLLLLITKAGYFAIYGFCQKCWNFPK